jgi:selenium-binding protein 1
MHASTRLFRHAFTALILPLALLLGTVHRAQSQSSEHKKARYLYIWAGDQARVAPDFVAVIDFDEDKKTYGRVLKTVPVPTSSNEAHHTHLSADGNTLACGGLLSLLEGQDGIFFFDVSAPANPVFLKSASAPLSAVTDHFYPLAEGGFLVTQMGSNTDGAPFGSRSSTPTSAWSKSGRRRRLRTASTRTASPSARRST